MSFETGQDARPASIPMVLSVEHRLHSLEQGYVSQEEFADFKLLTQVNYRRK